MFYVWVGLGVAIVAVVAFLVARRAPPEAARPVGKSLPPGPSTPPPPPPAEPAPAKTSGARFAPASVTPSASMAPVDGPTVELFLVGLKHDANHIQVIKAVREVTGLNLTDAKTAIDGIPHSSIRVTDADVALTRLREVGIEGRIGGPKAPPATTGPNVDLELVSIPDHIGHIEIITLIREITGLGLKEANALSGSLPSVILRNVPRDKAEPAMTRLTSAGVVARLKPTTARR